MAKDKVAKQAMVEALSTDVGGCEAAVLVDYSGVSTEDLRRLRRELHQHGSSLRVVKNRLARLVVAKDADFAPLVDYLKGPLALVSIRGDLAAGAKALVGFGKEQEKFTVKIGVLDGKVLPTANVKALADLPSREVLLGQILASLQSPSQGLLQVINGVGAKLVRALAAVKDTKS